MFVSLSVAAGVPSGRCLSQNGHRFCSATLNLSASVEIVAGYLLRELPTSCNRNDSMRDRPICRRDAGYVFTVGSTGDSPVPSGDPPDGTEHGIEGNNAVFSHSSYTTTPPGESPGGAGGSPAPPSVNRYDAGSTLERLPRSTVGIALPRLGTVLPQPENSAVVTARRIKTSNRLRKTSWREPEWQL